MNKKKRIEVACTLCEKILKRLKSQIKNKKNNFCNKKCKHNWQKGKPWGRVGARGKDNPNYGNVWTIEQRNRQSRKIKNKYNENDNYRYEVGKSNRGKKFSKERIKKMHDHRTFGSYSHPHTEKTKKLLRENSKKMWQSKDYRKKHAQTMIDRGYYLDPKDRDDYKLYRYFSDWQKAMFNLIINKDELLLLKKLKVFNPKINVNGVVRDHKYSVRSGFINKVFPEVLRHPVNCQILSNPDNIRKQQSNNIKSDSILLEQLFENIEKYKKEWFEQDICLNLILQYKNGKRYNKKEYIEKYFG